MKALPDILTVNHFIVLLLMIWAQHISDTAQTVWLYCIGSLVECNPAMAHILFNHGPVAFCLVKVVMLTIFTVLCWKFWQRNGNKDRKKIAWFLVVVVIAYNIVILVPFFVVWLAL